jgi:hypothetical protein
MCSRNDTRWETPPIPFEIGTEFVHWKPHSAVGRTHSARELVVHPLSQHIGPGYFDDGRGLCVMQRGVIVPLTALRMKRDSATPKVNGDRRFELKPVAASGADDFIEILQQKCRQLSWLRIVQDDN